MERIAQIYLPYLPLFPSLGDDEDGDGDEEEDEDDAIFKIVVVINWVRLKNPCLSPELFTFQNVRQDADSMVAVRTLSVSMDPGLFSGTRLSLGLKTYIWADLVNSFIILYSVSTNTSPII